MSRPILPVVVAVVVVAVSAAVGGGAAPPAPGAESFGGRAIAQTAGSVAASSAGAATALSVLPVKAAASMTGYSREQFGPAWADTDYNGCDQRNQVLARDMTGEIFKPGTHNCVVLAGRLADPYTARIIDFHRGPKTSDDVQIDHVVALGDAWQTGARQFTSAQREQLATDPLNLLAVDGPTNEGKGDKDAASLLPPNTGYRCAYVARQVAVKTHYRLWVTPTE
jgi:uncharacterized protein DUF1524